MSFSAKSETIASFQKMTEDMKDTTLCKNNSDITTALCIFQENMQERANLNKRVKTAFGNADINTGYEIKKITMGNFGIVFEVTMLDRSIKESDCTRNGDNVDFRVYKGKVYDEEEWEQL